MSQIASRDLPVTATRADSLRAWAAVAAELTKARLSGLVVVTTAAGFVLGSGRSLDWVTFLWVVAGTFMAAGSANAMNQVMERYRDAHMHRTRSRPLPDGRVRVAAAALFGVSLGVAGVAILAVFVGWLVALLGLANILIYLLLYTPLKTRTSVNTLVGAICGAIPPMMGWAAATGGLEAGAWILGAMLFVWQVPHFLALAWLYRRDYRRGGYRMLPQIDPAGRLTGEASVLFSLSLLAASLCLAVAHLTGVLYLVAALLLGLWMVDLSRRWAADMNDARARHLFLASIVYLPVLLGVMVLDRRPFDADALQLHAVPTDAVAIASGTAADASR